MLAYRISPSYKLILIRMTSQVSIDRLCEFIKSITSDLDYDPSYRIIVNDKTLEESEEVSQVCQSIDLAAAVIGDFFAKPNGKSAMVCYCR